jgi:uncharacterized protein involved in exopolysaccharide biosynthesis
MIEDNIISDNQFPRSLRDEEFSLKEFISIISRSIQFLKAQWLIICIVSLLGAGLFYLYAYFQKTIYKASLSFVLQDENQQGPGGSGLSSIASQFGVDIGGGASGVFSQENIIELIKSRELIERTLLTFCNINEKKQTIADFYIDSLGLRKNLLKNKELNNFFFSENQNRDMMPFNQRLLLTSIYQNIFSNLNVIQKDKKSSILVIEYKCQNETFAKLFIEMLISRVSDFYISTKSTKAKNNVDILQKQADSLRHSLNVSLSGVAQVNESTFNLNPSLSLKRVPSLKGQYDVQINSAMLTQILGSLEMAKITLRKETPLFFVIDKPVFPLNKTRPSKIIYFILGCIFFGVVTSLTLLFKKSLQNNK